MVPRQDGAAKPVLLPESGDACHHRAFVRCHVRLSRGSGQQRDYHAGAESGRLPEPPDAGEGCHRDRHMLEELWFQHHLLYGRHQLHLGGSHGSGGGGRRDGVAEDQQDHDPADETDPDLCHGDVHHRRSADI